MATLQKFKFLATQCAVSSSPTRSPTTSPVIHLRRRKTLRMLLGRGRSSSSSSNHRRFFQRAGYRSVEAEDEDRQRPRHHNHIGVRHKLKDLFVSSPPPLPRPPPSIGNSNAKKVQEGGGEEGGEEAEGLFPATARAVEGLGGGAGLVMARRMVAGPMTPLSATLRQRLLRRAWRPVLIGIPEHSP